MAAARSRSHIVRRTARALLVAVLLPGAFVASATAGTPWPNYGRSPQHTATAVVPSQSLAQILWQTPVDLNPQYSGNDLLIHYGTPLTTPTNTVLVPVKTGATDGFRIEAHDGYYGTLRRYEDGLPTLPGGQPYGTGPCAIIGITADSETARHDWRAYQDIKNALVGDEWEAVELYPAESRKVDPSNRFYLFCFPKGVFTFGWGHRNVVAPRDGSAPQRGWLTRGDACPTRR